MPDMTGRYRGEDWSDPRQPRVHLLAPVGKLNGVACNHYFKRSTPATTTNVNKVTCRGCLAARPDGVEHG